MAHKPSSSSMVPEAIESPREQTVPLGSPSASASLAAAQVTLKDAINAAHLQDRQNLFQCNLELLVLELLSAKREVHRLTTENDTWKAEYMKMEKYSKLVTKILNAQGLTNLQMPHSIASAAAAEGTPPKEQATTTATTVNSLLSQASLMGSAQNIHALLQAIPVLAKDLTAMAPNTPNETGRSVQAQAQTPTKASEHTNQQQQLQHQVSLASTSTAHMQTPSPGVGVGVGGSHSHSQVDLKAPRTPTHENLLSTLQNHMQQTPSPLPSPSSQLVKPNAIRPSASAVEGMQQGGTLAAPAALQLSDILASAGKVESASAAAGVSPSLLGLSTSGQVPLGLRTQVSTEDLKQVVLGSMLGMHGGEGYSSGRRKRNRGMNLPRRSVKRLKEFLYNNFDNPYPSEAQKSRLAKELDLDVVQVNTWFINARMRMWKPEIEKLFIRMKERLQADLDNCRARGPSRASTSTDKNTNKETVSTLLEKLQKVQEAEDPRAKVALMLTEEWSEKQMKDTRIKLLQKLESESHGHQVWASEVEFG